MNFQVNGDLDVQLLIEVNWLKAPEPQEEIASKENGPYIFRIRL